MIDSEPEQGSTVANNGSAIVTAVNYTGEPDNYLFSVTIESPDVGCNQYADWWEVFTPDGVLVYRRILTHSHVDEQPFTRTGGPVAVSADQEIIIRAHMNNLGYGTEVFRGGITQGFSNAQLSSTTAVSLALNQPLPAGCAF